MQSRPTAAIFSLLIASAFSLHAESRAWKSEDGKRSIHGEFLERDAASVTIRRSGGKDITIPLDKLHPDDRTWLNSNHPVTAAALPSKSAVFDQLAFGDSRNQVLAKLKASKFVHMTLDETFIGRTGLNGVFRTRNKIGGLDASLYFEWDERDGLKEITLQTASFPAGDLNTQLIPCWKEFIKLLTTLQGPPVTAESKLDISKVPSGAMMPTHLWKLEKSGSAMLGTARDGDDKYQIVVRFTQKRIEPVLIQGS